jgi:ABC-type amino acid transport system permease subunit
MKTNNIAKNMTLVIMLSAFIVGCVGAFIATFNMEGYSNFLRGFAPWYIALIGSIGVNSAVDKVKGGK